MPKVFELAKQLDMGALDLVEKLKGQGFNVRNHMSVLSDEDVQKVLQSFAKEKEQEEQSKTRKKNDKEKGDQKEESGQKEGRQEKGRWQNWRSGKKG